MDLAEAYKTEKEYAKLARRIQYAGEKGTGLRLSVKDVQTLCSTTFLEDYESSSAPAEWTPNFDRK